MAFRPDQIHAFLCALQSRGIEGIEEYGARLRANAGVLATLEDFVREGLVAATLSTLGFRVLLREAPDLDVRCPAASLYVEVARFRHRPEDDEDDAKLRSYHRSGRLVDHGDLAACSGQVLQKILRKVVRLPQDRPGLVAIYTDSKHQIEQPEVCLAMGEYNHLLRSGQIAARSFAGLLCLGGGPPSYRAAGHVGFYPAERSLQALPQEICELLRGAFRRVTLDDLLPEY